MPNNLYANPPIATAPRNAIAITPSDSADMPQASIYGIFVTGTGNVKVDMVGSGTAITFTGVAANSFLNIAARRVYATGTTATGLIALF